MQSKEMDSQMRLAHDVIVLSAMFGCYFVLSIYIQFTAMFGCYFVLSIYITNYDTACRIQEIERNRIMPFFNAHMCYVWWVGTSNKAYLPILL